VSTLPSSALPAWVLTRRGRLVPFEADRICQSLFAATVALGQPNAFLARELTDSVLHFLALEMGGSTPTTEQIAELTAKVVRELGQPALARAYVELQEQASPTASASSFPVPARFTPDDPPEAAIAACLREYSRQVVYSPDLVSAEADGLLTLTGLDTPWGLTCGLVAPAGGQSPDWLELLVEARQWLGTAAILEGLEYALGSVAGREGVLPVAAALERGLELTGLRLWVNLGSNMPPTWAAGWDSGPLFPTAPAAGLLGGREAAELLLDQFLRMTSWQAQLWIFWHVRDADLRVKGPAGGLRQALQAAACGRPVLFRFDRPRRPRLLGPGVTRQQPAVLLAVGVHLLHLAEVLGTVRDPAVLLRKVGSLMRLALSAAKQKRAFLRRQSRLASRPGRRSPGFLPERARLVVVPVGLEAAVRYWTGSSLCDAEGLVLGRQLVSHMQQVLAEEGAAVGLETCLDGLGASLQEWEREPAPPESVGPENAAGLTPWSWTATAEAQLHAAGALHALSGGGLATVLWPTAPPDAQSLFSLLRFAWRQTEVLGLRLVCRPVPPAELPGLHRTD
jgi:hypothetical protein